MFQDSAWSQIHDIHKIKSFILSQQKKTQFGEFLGLMMKNPKSLCGKLLEMSFLSVIQHTTFIYILCEQMYYKSSYPSLSNSFTLETGM